MILDCHTHRPAPQPDAVISLSPSAFSPFPGQLYSLGLHPWFPDSATDSAFARLRDLARRPDVVAIGEAGVDLLKAKEGSAPLFRQTLDFRRHVEISEAVGKPLIVHCVKAFDIIAGLRADLKPRQPWILHGFRAKPSVVSMMMRSSADFYFSFGEHFNPDSLRAVEPSRLLAETDESPLPILQIIDRLSQSLSTSSASLHPNSPSPDLSASLPTPSPFPEPDPSTLKSDPDSLVRLISSNAARLFQSPS